MYDYDGDFSHWQDKLDAEGIDFNVSNLAGATYNEIESTVNYYLSYAKRNSEIIKKDEDVSCNIIE